MFFLWGEIKAGNWEDAGAEIKQGSLLLQEEVREKLGIG
jgi:hypothetical protein